jgi:hypothetical protein
LFVLLAIGFFISVKADAQAGYGTVPTDPIPIGGLRIDGFLQRQGTAGDWLAASSGSPSGTYLFNNDGTKAAPFASYPLLFHKIDPYNQQACEQRFTGGSQLDDDPRTWHWDSQKPQVQVEVKLFTVHTVGNDFFILSFFVLK